MLPPIASVVASAVLLLASMADGALGEYQPCPLLAAYYPPPVIDKTSDQAKGLASQLSSTFDDLVRTGVSDDFGAVTPNTTSFSVVLFTGGGASSAAEDAIFFEYHHTAPLANASAPVTANTVFPAGALTQLFAVYLWLAEVGDREWQTPITEYLPELIHANASSADALGVAWQDVTVGALAGQMSGLARDSGACKLAQPCDRKAFLDSFASAPPLFLPDTTPVVSNAAFQLLALALPNASAASRGRDFGGSLAGSILEPLNMSSSALFGSDNPREVFGEGLSSDLLGEIASLGLLTTTSDLARAGHSMLASTLLRDPSVTRRWLQPIADTSNLRNGVGRPWEIYHAGRYANSSILDVYTKTGSVWSYASYFGLTPDFNAGFAILAHDAAGAGAPDLNVYADIVSGALEAMLPIAAQQLAGRFAGVYGSNASADGLAVFNVTSEPGLTVEALAGNGSDFRLEAARAAGIKLENLDFKLYPTNVKTAAQHQFVAVFQDKTAPVDQDTPTCITWMDVASRPGVVDRVIFHLDDQGVATAVELAAKQAMLLRSQ